MQAVLPPTLLFLAIFHTGLIWIVQVVHYPIFRAVSPGDFAAFHEYHTRRISWIVVPTMLLELGLTTLDWFWLRGIASAPPLIIAAHLCVYGVWASTVFIQVPLHNQLARGHDIRAINRLVATNWIRTVLWTARGGLLLFAMG